MTHQENHRNIQTLHGWFLEAARQFPGNTAVKSGTGDMSYRDLETASASFAVKVRELSGREAFVGVWTRRSPGALAGILGILRAGKAYLPLNPRFPTARAKYMLLKSGTGTIIAGDDSLAEIKELLRNFASPLKIILPDEVNAASWEMEYPQHSFHHCRPEKVSWNEMSPDPERPAYLMFTSGSTGMPKGVPVSHGNVSAYLRFVTRQFNFNPGDRFSQTFDLTFDLSVHDLFVCWASGAALCLPSDNTSFGLARYLKEIQPSVWFSVPSVAALMERMRLLKPGSHSSLRYSFFCGEPLQTNVAAAWSNAAPRSKVINLYGPTEATIAVTFYELPGDRSAWKQKHGILSIGKPFPGHKAILAGESRNELLLEGPQVVKGYLDEDILTAENFLESSPGGPGNYRTGDMAEQDAEGDLFFLGRSDMEVKISGYRVNLNEIEHTLRGLAGIAEAVAIYGEKSGLAVFIQPAEDKGLVASTVLDCCRESLPWYMVPEKVIFVKEIPLNPNGKTDRKALYQKYLAPDEKAGDPGRIAGR